MTYYLGVSVLVFLFLTYIWKSSDAVNLFLRLLFITMTVTGTFLFLQELGYIVKVVKV